MRRWRLLPGHWSPGSWYFVQKVPVSLQSAFIVGQAGRTSLWPLNTFYSRAIFKSSSLFLSSFLLLSFNLHPLCVSE